jgi:hypothetical protein
MPRGAAAAIAELTTPYASTAAVFHRRRYQRLDVVGRDHLVMSLNTNDRKDDDGCGFVYCFRAAKTHDPAVVREFDNGTHVVVQPMSAA